jgi:hypothetical protein
MQVTPSVLPSFNALMRPHIWSPKAFNEIFEDIFNLDEQVYARPFTPSDSIALYRLTQQFPLNYPNHFNWLDKKIDEVLSGRATCHVICRGADIVGMAIETPKGKRNQKLNLFYFGRKLGLKQIGKLLFNHLAARWEFKKIDMVYGTVPMQTAAEKLDGATHRYFLARGADHIAHIEGLYHPDKVEAVLTIDVGKHHLLQGAQMVEVGFHEGIPTSWNLESEKSTFLNARRVIVPSLADRYLIR